MIFNGEYKLVSKIDFLRKHSLKPTKQRILLADLLFKSKKMHFCAEDLKKILSKHGHKIAVATIYNNLRSFVDAGLLVQRCVDRNKYYFDNNLSNHFHFYDKQKQTFKDFNTSSVKFAKLPKIPKNKKIQSIDLVINLENK